MIFASDKFLLKLTTYNPEFIIINDISHEIMAENY